MDLSGKVAIVTGAAKGLGWAIAERLAKDGAAVIVADVDGKGAQDAANRLGAGTGKSLAVQADVSRAADVEKMVKEVLGRFGKIDILVNNAGILGPYADVADYPEEIWDQIMAVNLKGTFLCCKAVLPHMKERRGGKIVSLASVAGKEGNAKMAPYAASKAAIMSLTKTLGKETATLNIQVNCVTPALCETDMAREMTPEQRAFLISKIPMGRLGKPEEVAAVVKFLASDESSFVTGQCYDISGGRSVY
ncbi:MAG TPA: SDR family NAD(P)-dependent oxidoreductase [Thermodesulfobacteriota bacterium]|nr:SDR family NAD(P)-dependent oxidoreductase [Thermodesulfobacteriota bacterium]